MGCHEHIGFQFQQQVETFLIPRPVTQEIAVIDAVIVDPEVCHRVARHEDARAIMFNQEPVVINRLTRKIKGSQLIPLPVDYFALGQRVVDSNAFREKAGHQVRPGIFKDVLEFLLNVNLRPKLSTDLINRFEMVVVIVADPNPINSFDGPGYDQTVNFAEERSKTAVQQKNRSIFGPKIPRGLNDAMEPRRQLRNRKWREKELRIHSSCPTPFVQYAQP